MHLHPPPKLPNRQLLTSASWLYWVAGMSLLNLVTAASGFHYMNGMGLGITFLLGHAGRRFGSIWLSMSVGVSVVVIILLCLFGYLASKGFVWAFIAGITALVLDSLLLIPAHSFISLAIHIFAICSLFVGLKLARELHGP
jgi:hypothetical protein